METLNKERLCKLLETRQWQCAREQGGIPSSLPAFSKVLKMTEHFSASCLTREQLGEREMCCPQKHNQYCDLILGT